MKFPVFTEPEKFFTFITEVHKTQFWLHTVENN